MKTLEEWREIPDCPGYDISRFGEVRSWHNTGRSGRQRTEPKPVKPYRDKCGTWRINITHADGKRRGDPVISLMVRTWLKSPEGYKAYHKNGIRSDNRLDNIAFTEPEMILRKIPTRNNSNRRPVVKLDKKGNVIKIYKSITAASQHNYISYTAVYNRCHNLVTDPTGLDGYNYQFTGLLEE